MEVTLLELLLAVSLLATNTTLIVFDRKHSEANRILKNRVRDLGVKLSVLRERDNEV